MTYVNDHAASMAKAVVSAKSEWEATFWRLSGLSKASKASSDDATSITALELQHIKAVLRELRDKGASEAYVHAVYGKMLAAYEHGWGNAKEVLRVKLDFDGPAQSFAMNALRERSQDFAVLVTDRENRTILTLLDQALADGWTPKRLSSEISSAFSAGMHIYDDEGELQRVIPTDAWSKIVARTELSRAQTQGAITLYADAGVKTVQYVTSGGSSVCDECEPHDGEVYDLADLGDEDTPPLHPGCCCSLTPYDEDVRYQPSDEEAA